MREVSVRLLDISSAGCLLESESRLEKGTTGLLRIMFEGAEYMDDVRVMRCSGGDSTNNLYTLGAEFLWTTSPHERSLRRMPARLHGAAVKEVRFGVQM